jgi:23S rRNA-/tRNA-specific pseudouridylate synthase
VVCEEPILTVSHKLALNVVSKQGKPSKTVFQRLRFDGKHSIVECKPLTGRTHQIRVHLQYLGFPIVNDPLYHQEKVWGPSLGKQQELNQEQQQDIVSKLSTVVFPWDKEEEREDTEPTDELYCLDCTLNRADPTADQLKLYLHALKYEADGWSYETPLPEWAK